MSDSKLKLDIVLVIDATDSMGPFIDDLHDFVPALYGRLDAARETLPLSVRIRIVDFADYMSEGDDTLHESDFFEMPEDMDKLLAYTSYIRYDMRGADMPENALEGLWLAMRSDFRTPTPFGAHIIVMLTDAMPLRLQERADCIGYDSENTPSDIQEMEDIWNDPGDVGLSLSGRSSHRELILCAPGGRQGDYTWEEVMDWRCVEHVGVQNGGHLLDLSADTVADLILHKLTADCPE